MLRYTCYIVVFDSRKRDTVPTTHRLLNSPRPPLQRRPPVDIERLPLIRLESGRWQVPIKEPFVGPVLSWANDCAVPLEWGCHHSVENCLSGLDGITGRDQQCRELTSTS